MESSNPPFAITDRTFVFATRILELCHELGRNPVNRVLGGQLLKAGTSVGANVEESQAAQSKADFISKCTIALKEAREAHYWLRLIAATDRQVGPRIGELVQEAREVRDILGAIARKAKKNAKGG